MSPDTRYWWPGGVVCGRFGGVGQILMSSVDDVGDDVDVGELVGSSVVVGTSGLEVPDGSDLGAVVVVVVG